MKALVVVLAWWFLFASESGTYFGTSTLVSVTHGPFRTKIECEATQKRLREVTVRYKVMMTECWYAKATD